MARCAAILLAQMVFVCGAAAGLPQVSSDVQVKDLRCEYLADPLGIDVAQPRLSWKLQSQWRGQKQTAYQVLVASRRSLLDEDKGDRWDSGRGESERSIHVAYGGQPLASRNECWWKVRVWDHENRLSAWSEPACWSMGILKDADWAGAKWIGLEEADDQGVEIADVKAAQWLWYPEGKPAFHAPAAARYLNGSPPELPASYMLFAQVRSRSHGCTVHCFVIGFR